MPTQRQQQAKSTINNPASPFLGLWRWIRQYDITKHASTTSHFRNFLMSKSKRDFLSERRNRRSNADATPTTSKINKQQSSFHFFGIRRWIRRFDITKHVCTTSHFQNFLMSKSKRDFLSERRNRRSNADATPTTSKINKQQSSFHFFGIRRWIRRFDITKHVCTTSHFQNFLMSKSKRDFLSERRNRRSNAVSIIWARVQQRRFTGEIIVPKQLYFEKAFICSCKTCGPSIRTYCYLSPVKRRCWTHVQRDWWVKFCKFSERFCCAQECLGGLKAVIAVHNPKFGH